MPDTRDLTEQTKNASPPDKPAALPGQQAMQDADMAERLEENPQDLDVKLDVGLDESMDASDPPSALTPGDDGEPMPSSGYDPAAERANAQE